MICPLQLSRKGWDLPIITVRKSDCSAGAHQDDRLWDQTKSFREIVDSDLVHSQLEIPPFEQNVHVFRIKSNNHAHAQ